MKAIFLYVECDKCHEKIKVRINPDTDVDNYILKKEILGNNCQNLMYAELLFDKNYNITSNDVTGGRLITEEEYLGR